MKLHPVKDGLIPDPHERGVTKRDRAGNALRDKIDPKTGFCVGVTSPMTPTGKSVSPASHAGGGSGPDIRYDDNSARYYDLIRSAPDAPVGLVIRLVSDGDENLPCTRIRVVEAPKSDSGAERNSSAPVRKPESTRKQNDAAVKAVLDAMGYKGPIDRALRTAVLEMIATERAVGGNRGKTARKPSKSAKPAKPSSTRKSVSDAVAKQ